jgi:DNA primase
VVTRGGENARNMIPQNVIDEIRDRTDIVHVIGSMIDLKKSGRNYKALCPFHAEKTPSFMVSPEKQIYHCFGCGKGGNVFHFLMEYEGSSFVEAVRHLGRELGIDVDRYVSPGGERARLDPYYRAVEHAAKFYHAVLREGAEAAHARRYLAEREIGDDLIEQFRIGLAPSGWDRYYREILLELNLILKGRGGYRDYFRNRIIFPIETVSKRIVGMAGRVLDDSEPKYLNSMESPIYHKSKILYGLGSSREGIKKSGFVLLVEGYIDHLMLWHKGFRNISAVCGTSLTGDQIRLLARYTKRVYIINDGDRAGVRAAVRAADQLLIEGMEAQIVFLPEGEDPDSFVRKRGAEALRSLVSSAPHYFEYLKWEAERGDRTLYRKDQIVKHLLDTVSRTGDEIKKELYLQEMGRLFEIPVEKLRGGLRKAKREGTSARAVGSEAPKREKVQKQLFRVGFEGERYARMIVENLFEEDLHGRLFREFYKALDLALKNNIDITSPDFAGGIEDTELSNLVSEVALMPKPPGPIDALLNDTLIWLKRASLRDELEVMKKRLRELQLHPETGTPGEEVAIAEAYRKIAKELGNVSLKEVGQSNGAR